MSSIPQLTGWSKEQKTTPVLIRLCKADHELVKKRASMLGMNLSTFLRLLIRTGRIELDEGSWMAATQKKGREKSER